MERGDGRKRTTKGKKWSRRESALLKREKKGKAGWVFGTHLVLVEFGEQRKR